MVIIPYWWDTTPESIAQTIHLHRPDVQLPAALLRGDPIPTKPFHLATKVIPYYPQMPLNTPISFDPKGWYTHGWVH